MKKSLIDDDIRFLILLDGMLWIGIAELDSNLKQSVVIQEQPQMRTFFVVMDLNLTYYYSYPYMMLGLKQVEIEEKVEIEEQEVDYYQSEDYDRFNTINIQFIH